MTRSQKLLEIFKKIKKILFLFFIAITVPNFNIFQQLQHFSTVLTIKKITISMCLYDYVYDTQTMLLIGL